MAIEKKTQTKRLNGQHYTCDDFRYQSTNEKNQFNIQSLSQFIPNKTNKTCAALLTPNNLRFNSRKFSTPALCYAP